MTHRTIVVASVVTLVVLTSSSCAPPCMPPVLFGHRGTTLYAPANTLPAFAWAFDNGADARSMQSARPTTCSW